MKYADAVFFVESRGGGHSVLFRSPSGQTTIMSSHVSFGLALAERNRLAKLQQVAR